MKQILNTRNLAIVGIIALAAVTRLLPHPPNVTPLLAMALFGGAYIGNKNLAFALPIAAMFISDLFFGLHSSMFAVYLCFAAVVALGFYLRQKKSPGRIVLASLGGSVLFFVVTNFSVWLLSGMYTLDLSGLTLCYTNALPFFRNALFGNMAYTVVLFGGFAMAERYIPQLSPAANS